MPANPSTPEVTRADEARRLIAKLAGADIDVSGTAAIGITSADIIDANGWLAVDRVASTVMAGAGEDAEIKRLRGLLIDPGTPPWEDARAVLVAELRKAGFKGAAKQIEEGEGCNIPSHVALKLIAQAALSAPQVEGLTSGEGDARKLLVDMFGRRVGYSSRMAVEAMLAFAAASPKATATASVREDTVAFVQEWLMSSDHAPTQWDRDFAAAIDARAAGITDALIERMVTRFLGWKLPADFAPDGGISFKNVFGQRWPVGTNLFTAAQAAEMVRTILALTDSGTAATIGGERA